MQKDLFAASRFTAEIIDGAFSRGVVGLGNRTTAKATISTESGYLRIDSVPLYAGRGYLVAAFNLRATQTVTTDHFKFNLRYDGTGASATTSSTEIGRSEITSSTNDNAAPAFGFVAPASDTTGSFLLSLIRTSGTGTATINADVAGVSLVVVDLALTVANTGISV